VPAVVESATTIRGATSTTESTTTTTVPAASTTSATGDPPHVSLIATGDTDPTEPGDMAARLAPLRPFLAGFDLAICQLTRSVTPAAAAALAGVGYDRCAAASEHAFDAGLDGVRSAVAALDAAHLSQSGLAGDAGSTLPPPFEVAGIRLAHLSYTFGFDGAVPGPDAAWSVAVADPAKVVADATAERAAGARAVVVSIRWGREGVAATSDYQRRIADAITASGVVDLILGSRSHVVQPIEQVHGVWVAYGLGDSATGTGAGDGIALVCTLQQAPDGHISVQRPVVIPTWQEPGASRTAWPVWSTLAARASGTSAGGALATAPEPSTAALAASLARTRKVVGPFVPAGDPH
jgi:poly-gamma-glutamate synthesis protein (capsule biosynthesis protein)